MLRLSFTQNFATKFNGLRSGRTSIQSHINQQTFLSPKIIRNNFHSYSSTRAYTIEKQKPSVALTFLGISGVSSLYLVAHRPILNDASFVDPSILVPKKKIPNACYDPNTSKYDGAFDGTLNYHHVAMGSVTGLIIGYALSRLSSIIFIFAILSYSLSVYLRKQGIKVVNTKSVVKNAINNVSWDTIVFEQPSFTIPFVLSFLTSATL